MIPESEAQKRRFPFTSDDIRQLLADETELPARAWQQELRAEWGLAISSTAMDRAVKTRAIHRERVGRGPSGRGSTGYYKRREFIGALFGAYLRSSRVAEKEIARRVREFQDLAGGDRRRFLVECALAAIEFELEFFVGARELTTIEDKLVERAADICDEGATAGPNRRAAYLRRGRSAGLIDHFMIAQGRDLPAKLPELSDAFPLGPWPLELAWVFFIVAARGLVSDTPVRDHDHEVELYDSIRDLIRIWLLIPPGLKGTIEGFDPELLGSVEGLRRLEAAAFEELGRALPPEGST